MTTQTENTFIERLLSKEFYESNKKLYNRIYNINPKDSERMRHLDFQMRSTHDVYAKNRKGELAGGCIGEIKIDNFKDLLEHYGKDKAIRIAIKALKKELEFLTHDIN